MLPAVGRPQLDCLLPPLISAFSHVCFRNDLPKAGLANITATYINLLGLDAPSLYEPSLITTN